VFLRYRLEYSDSRWRCLFLEVGRMLLLVHVTIRSPVPSCVSMSVTDSVLLVTYAVISSLRSLAR